eukprot:5906733-Amphidinium_carterae.1
MDANQPDMPSIAHGSSSDAERNLARYCGLAQVQIRGDDCGAHENAPRAPGYKCRKLGLRQWDCGG